MHLQSRRAFTLMGALFLGVSLPPPDASGSEHDALEKRVTLSLRREGARVRVTLKPTDGHSYVNSAYPASCDLQSDGTIDKAHLAMTDFTVEESGKPGKAKSVSAVVKAERALRARCKVVVCSDSACSSPFVMEVKE